MLAIASTPELSESSTNLDTAPPAFAPSAASKLTKGSARPLHTLKAIVARASPTFAAGTAFFAQSNNSVA